MVERGAVAYEVTVSDELRALWRARGSSLPDPSYPKQRPVRRRGGGGAPVFVPRRLRNDGSRPVKVTASEILVVNCESDGESTGDFAAHNAGLQSISILLTENGECLAQMVASAPRGVPARPVFRVRELRSPRDMTDFIRTCHADLLGQVANRSLSGARSASDAIAIEESSSEFAEALAPFVRKNCNER